MKKKNQERVRELFHFFHICSLSWDSYMALVCRICSVMTLKCVHYLGDGRIGARGGIMPPRQGHRIGVASLSDSGDWHAMWMHFLRAPRRKKVAALCIGNLQASCACLCAVCRLTTLALISVPVPDNPLSLFGVPAMGDTVMPLTTMLGLGNTQKV